MALKEALSADTVRGPDDRTGTSLEVLHHPDADALVIQSEVELGDRTLPLIGPQDLIRPAQGHTHDDTAISSRRDGRDGLGPPHRHRSCDAGAVSWRRRLGLNLVCRLGEDP